MYINWLSSYHQSCAKRSEDVAMYTKVPCCCCYGSNENECPRVDNGLNMWELGGKYFFCNWL